MSERFRIIASGGRDFLDRQTVRNALFGVAREAGGYDRILVVHGHCPASNDAPGADQLAEEWACDHWHAGVRIERHPAGWDHCAPDCPPRHRIRKRPGDTVHPGRLPDYCPGAGPRRNAEMVAKGGRLLLAFPTPASRGTWNAVRLAKAAGIEVRIIRSTMTTGAARA